MADTVFLEEIFLGSYEGVLITVSGGGSQLKKTLSYTFKKDEFYVV